MKRFFLKWALTVLALIVTGLVTSLFMKGFSVKVGSSSDVMNLFIGVAVLTLVNTTLGRLLKFLAIPLNCLTFGLAAVAINGLMFFLVSTLNFGFHADNYLAALVASVVFSLTCSILHQFLPDSEKDD